MKFKVVVGFIKIVSSADSATRLVPGEYCTSKGICVFINIARIASSSAIRIFFEDSSFENTCEVNSVLNSLLILLLLLLSLLHLDKGHPSLHYILC
jgi:hypothetical protein